MYKKFVGLFGFLTYLDGIYRETYINSILFFQTLTKKVDRHFKLSIIDIDIMKWNRVLEYCCFSLLNKHRCFFSEILMKKFRPQYDACMMS